MRDINIYYSRMTAGSKRLNRRTSQQFYNLGLECGVTGQCVALGVTIFASPGAEISASLAHDHRKWTVIPNSQKRIDTHFRSASCHKHKSVRIAPCPQQGFCFRKALHNGWVFFNKQLKIRSDHARLGHLADIGNMRAASIPPTARAVCCAQHLIQWRVIRRAHTHDAIYFQSDQDAIQRHTMDERLSPVNRVYRPAKRAVMTVAYSKFLAHNCVTRVLALDLTADKIFRLMVCDGNRVVFLFYIYMNTGIEMSQCNFPRAISKRSGEIKIVLQIHNNLFNSSFSSL